MKKHVNCPEKNINRQRICEYLWNKTYVYMHLKSDSAWKTPKPSQDPHRLQNPFPKDNQKWFEATIYRNLGSLIKQVRRSFQI